MHGREAGRREAAFYSYSKRSATTSPYFLRPKKLSSVVSVFVQFDAFSLTVVLIVLSPRRCLAMKRTLIRRFVCPGPGLNRPQSWFSEKLEIYPGIMWPWDLVGAVVHESKSPSCGILWH
jgi:hypothetical protein